MNEVEELQAKMARQRWRWVGIAIAVTVVAGGALAWVLWPTTDPCERVTERLCALSSGDECSALTDSGLRLVPDRCEHALVRMDAIEAHAPTPLAAATQYAEVVQDLMLGREFADAARRALDDLWGSMGDREAREAALDDLAALGPEACFVVVTDSASNGHTYGRIALTRINGGEEPPDDLHARAAWCGELVRRSGRATGRTHESP